MNVNGSLRVRICAGEILSVIIFMDRKLFIVFCRYLSVGMSNAGSSTGFEDDIAEHDGSAYLDDLPES